MVILFLSCNAGTTNTGTTNAGTTNNQKPGISDMANAGNSISTYFWTGRINSTTPLFIWIAIKDSTIQGELVYTNTKGNAPIKLLGRLNRTGPTRVCEYQPDGNIVGTFVFDQLSAAATGSWESTDSHKNYKFALQAKDTALQRIDTSFQPKIIPGIYTYMYGTRGQQARISLQETEDYKGLLDIESFTYDPVKQSNMSDKRSVWVKGNQCIYTIKAAATSSFQIKFYNNFLIVDYVKDFGDSATHSRVYPLIEGVYYKTSLKDSINHNI